MSTCYKCEPQYREIPCEEIIAACDAIILALKPFPNDTKFAALTLALDSFPDKDSYEVFEYVKD